MEQVRAREDLPIGGGFIKKGTVGIVCGRFPLATGGEVLIVDWENSEGPRVSRNAMPGEYELIVS